LLIAVGAIESALEVALRHDAARQLDTTLWFAVPAVATVVLALLWRRHFPFAATPGESTRSACSPGPGFDINRVRAAASGAQVLTGAARGQGEYHAAAESPLRRARSTDRGPDRRRQ
jgi:hypothetical protein